MLKAIHKKYLSNKTKLVKTNLGNNKNRLSRYSKGIPIASATMLFGVLTVSGLAHAETSGTVDLTANVAEAGLSLTLSNTAVALNLAAPYSGTAFDSEPVTVTVSAHNGYSLVMYGGTNLVSGNNTISPLGSACNSGCNSTNFTTNAWGYSIDNTTSYKPMASGYNQLKSKTGDLSGDATIVNLGAKVDYTQTPGAYTTTLNFLAVANVTTPITMQSITNSTLAATYCSESGPTLLTDARDNKNYLVQRLADGKCWMLDNLAFDPTAYTGTDAQLANLTNVNDVMNGETVAVSKTQIITALKSGAGTAGITNTSGQYASSGVVANPNTAATAGLWGPTIELDGCTAELEAAGSCTDNYTVPRVNTSNISNYQYPAWSPNSTSANHDDSTPSYGSYNIGVYYNYCAASAGSYCYAKNAGTGNATSDICPAGWRLPTGGPIDTEAGTGEFKTLYDSYGGATAINGINGYALRAALSLQLTGLVEFSPGTVQLVGWTGRLWSSTLASVESMYNLYMNDAGVNPMNGNGRPGGITVRCILND